MGGLGLVGRISGVGKKTSRVLLLSDVSSSIPITIQKIGRKGLVIGDNSLSPTVNFLGNSRSLMPGMRITTSGEGKVFPPDLLIGTLVLDTTGKMRVSLAAELNELNYLRVLFKNKEERLTEPGSLILK